MKLHENRSYVISQNVKDHLKSENCEALDITYGAIQLLADTLSIKHRQRVMAREVMNALDSITHE